MPKAATNHKVELERSKQEILALKSQADKSDTDEGTIIAATIDWLFDSNADSPLTESDDESAEDDEDTDTFDDFEDDEEELEEDTEE